MASKKLTKKQLREKQILEDKKFNKTMLISFSLLFLAMILVLVFFTYWCDTKYNYRKTALYSKEVPYELVCMVDNLLQYHESSKFVHKNKVFYLCRLRCYQYLIKHYEKAAFVTDAFSGDTISKSDALIGFIKQGEPEVIYLKNKQNFKNYYANKNK